MMPDRTADAGAGATGWAVGSQDCSGIMPADVYKRQDPRQRFLLVSYISVPYMIESLK